MSILTASSQFAPPRRTAWQESLRRAVRDPHELCRLLQLDSEWADRAAVAARLFRLLVPREFVARMQTGDPHDPLLRQVLPLDGETVDVPGFENDPVGDLAATVRPGLLQKYRGRALLMAAPSCAVHCRYCFRRHFPYEESPRRPDAWDGALDALTADPSIDEIILSGGDPLMLADRQLADLVARLASIPHLRRLRVHTRLPVMIPSRVNDDLLSWLGGTRLAPIVVVHINHPAEIDSATAAALARLVDAGIVVLNQTVLLRGVNDSLEVLVSLCERLVDLRVMPYYLHQLDHVAGAAHFEVPVAIGSRLVRDLRERLPGYAVPRYVREQAGAKHKISLL